MIMITIMIKKKIKYSLFLIGVFTLSCSSAEVEERPSRINCGKITRLWSQNSSADEGNPCGDNRDSSREFAFIVKNDLTGNEKHFCINSSVYIRYKLGSIYCDDTNLDGW